MIDILLYPHHLPAWYCIDIVRRNSLLVTCGSEMVNISFHYQKSLKFFLKIFICGYLPIFSISTCTEHFCKSFWNSTSVLGLLMGSPFQFGLFKFFILFLNVIVIQFQFKAWRDLGFMSAIHLCWHRVKHFWLKNYCQLITSILIELWINAKTNYMKINQHTFGTSSFSSSNSCSTVLFFITISSDCWKANQLWQKKIY